MELCAVRLFVLAKSQQYFGDFYFSIYDEVITGKRSSDNSRGNTVCVQGHFLFVMNLPAENTKATDNDQKKSDFH